jgi:hypothetical protein
MNAQAKNIQAGGAHLNLDNHDSSTTTTQNLHLINKIDLCFNSQKSTLAGIQAGVLFTFARSTGARSTGARSTGARSTGARSTGARKKNQEKQMEMKIHVQLKAPDILFSFKFS